MYEEKTPGNRRMWGFRNLTKRLSMHVSRLVRTQISTHEFTVLNIWPLVILLTR